MTPSLQERLRFLNEATIKIGASLDLEETVHGLGGAVVPSMADFAAIYMVDGLLSDSLPGALMAGKPDTAADVVRRVAAVAAGDTGSGGGAAPEGERLTVTTDTPGGRAMASRKPVLVTGVDHSMLAVPLLAGQRVLGYMILEREPGRPAFDDVDTLTAAQLAAQGGLGIHSALLYRREAATADTLQRSMIPAKPPRLAGVEIAHRYLPGGTCPPRPRGGEGGSQDLFPARTARVGGDWFDAIPLPGGRVAFVVGDVMGHGLRSAAIMGHLRTAVQTLAALDLPPEQVLRHLDGIAQRLDSDHLATCIYVVYDPVARTCVMANAGHLPPVLVDGCGHAELLEDLPTGAPIGVGGVAFEPAEVKTADGDLLVLCTDGLVEARGRDIGAGLAALRENLAAPALPPDVLCDLLLRSLHTENREDDAALLIARLNGIPTSNVAEWLLHPGPATPRTARRLIGRTLAAWGLSSCRDTTELLATELATNAVRVASRPIQLRLMRTDVLLCEVSDDDHELPVLREITATAEVGRGLNLVSRLSHRWGANRTASGKVVWFEIALPEGQIARHDGGNPTSSG